VKGCGNGSLIQTACVLAGTGYGRDVKAAWGAEFILSSVQDLILLQSVYNNIFSLLI